MYRKKCRLSIMITQISNLLRIFALNISAIHSRLERISWTSYAILLLVLLITQFAINMKDMIIDTMGDRFDLSATVSIFLIFATETCCAVLSIMIGLLRYNKKIRISKQLFELENLWSGTQTVSEKASRFLWLRMFWPFFLFLFFCFLMDLFSLTSQAPSRARMIIMMHYSARLIAWTDIYYFVLILKIVRRNFANVNNELIRLAPLATCNLHTIETMCKVHQCLRKICKRQNVLYDTHFWFLTFYLIANITAYLFLVISADVAFLASVGVSNIYVGNVIAMTYLNVHLGIWITFYFILCFMVLKNIVNTVEEVSGGFNFKLSF